MNKFFPFHHKNQNPQPSTQLKQKRSKIFLITSFVISAYLFSSIHFSLQGFGLPRIALASPNSATPVVNTTISVANTGSEPFDGNTWDGSDLATAGLDEGGDNNVVRIQDSITYKVEVSVNDAAVDNLVAVVELDKRQAWLSIPTGCQTDADLVDPISAISDDKRTLTCNFGAAIEGTERVFYPVARALAASYDGTIINLNDDQVEANVSAYAVGPTGTSNMAEDGPTDVTVTADFKVSTTKELKSTAVDPDTGEPTYRALAKTNQAGNVDGSVVEYTIKVTYQNGSMIANAPDEANDDYEIDFTLLDHYTDDNPNNSVLYTPSAGSPFTISTGAVLYDWDPDKVGCELIGDHGPNASVTCTQVNHILDDLNGSGIGSDGVNDPNIEILLENIDVRDPDQDSNLVELRINIWNSEPADIATTDTCPPTPCQITTINSVGVYSPTGGIGNTPTVVGFNPVSTEDASNNHLENYNGAGEPHPEFVDYDLIYTLPGSWTVRKSFYGINSQAAATGKPTLTRSYARGATIPLLMDIFEYRNLDGAQGQFCDKLDTNNFEYVGLSEPNRTDTGYSLNSLQDYNPLLAIDDPSGGYYYLDASPWLEIYFSDEPHATLTEQRDDNCDDDVNGDGTYVVDGIDIATGLPSALPNDWVTDPSLLDNGNADVAKIRVTNTLDTDVVHAVEPAADRTIWTINFLVRIKDDATGYTNSTSGITYLPNFSTSRKHSGDGNWEAWATHDGGTYDVSVDPEDADFSYEFVYADRVILIPSSISLQKYTEPRGLKVVKSGETVEFIIEPQVHGGWSPTITTAQVVDTVATGTPYIIGSERFSTDDGATWLTYDEYLASNPDVTLTTVANNDANRVLNWDFGDLQTGEQIPLIRYAVQVDPSLASGTFINTVTFNSDIGVDEIGGGDPDGTGPLRESPDGTSDEKEARYEIQILPANGVQVEKSVDEKVHSVNSPFSYDLTYTNLGGEDYTNAQFIDILPYVDDGTGDNTSGLASTRYPNSTFSGTYQLTNITAGNSETFEVSTDTPTMIQQDPCHEDNWALNAVPVTGTLCYDFYVSATISPTKAANTFAGGSAQGTGVTTWNTCTSVDPTTCGVDTADITAIRFAVPSLPGSDAGHTISIELTPEGNVGGTPAFDADGNVTQSSTGDIYTNNFGGRVSEIALVFISNDVAVTMVSGSIGDRVWYDDNGNGGQEIDESGIPTVTLRLLDNTGQPIYVNPLTGGVVISNTPDAIPYTAVTDGNGNYRFDNLPAGTYEVEVDPTTLPAGVQQSYDASGGLDNSSTHTLSTVTDSAGQVVDVEDNAEQDFGYEPFPRIGNRVWADTNNNGVIDGSEENLGIDGVTVELLDDGGSVISTTTTTNNGYYLFVYDNIGANLTEGEYQVRIPASNFASDGPLENYQSSAVDGGDPDNNTDNDDNGPGSGQGVITSDLISVTVGLEPDINLDGDDVAGNMTVDFGFFLPPVAAVGNYVWLDEDGDGVQDAGEHGIPNVIVTLTPPAGVDLGNGLGQVITTTTDANGGYLFDDLPPADGYVVSINDSQDTISDSSLSYTVANNGGTSNQPDLGNQNPAGYTVDLSAGETDLSADFGYNYNPSSDVDGNTGTSAIGDTIWIDSDGDGIEDPSETPVKGVVVTLYNDPDGDSIFNTAVATTTTDATGHYIFDSLSAGPYAVGVTDSSAASHDILGAGYTQSGDPDHFGETDTNPTNNDNFGEPILLAPGDVFLNMDFGYQPSTAVLNSIGDTVFYDADLDGDGPSLVPVDGGAALTQGAGGTADADEYGIQGVTVSLINDTNGNGIWDAGEPIIASDTTDENGQYFFEDLADGDYLVWVNDADGILSEYRQTYDADGTATADISAVDLDSAEASGTAVDERDQDFGYSPSDNSGAGGMIGDTVWFDLNGDGNQDPAEQGISGAVVQLEFPDGSTITTTTDTNGNYLFPNLPVSTAGETYTVTVDANTLPPGMSQTFDDDGLGTPNRSAVTLTTVDPIDLDQDFGYNGLNTLGNLVWEDANADGVWDGADGPDGIANNDDDEPLIEGVTIDVYLDNNGNGVLDSGDALVTTATSAASVTETSGDNGNYLVEGLPDGTYFVSVSDEDGVVNGYWHSLGTPGTSNHSQNDAYDTIDLDSAESSGTTVENLTADFGYYVEPAALGNLIWLDTNQNGLQDNSEVGIDGVEVELTVTYPDNTVVTLTTKTGDNPDTGMVETGWYSFDNLLTDEGFNGTTADSSEEPTYEISVDANQPALNPYLPSTVDASSATNDLNDSDDHTGVTATATQGLSDTDQKSDATTEGANASYDFGFISKEPLGTIGNYIWLDENGDGVQDEGERGIPNVIVDLVDGSGNIFTTTTDSNGGYLFDNLPAGTYTVTVSADNSVPNGALDGLNYTTSNSNSGGDFGNQDPTGYPVTIGESEPLENLTADFGYNYNTASETDSPAGDTAAIGDSIWIDSDGDGIQDPNEIGVSGVELTLYHDPDGNGIYDTVYGTITTNANGHYIFDDLPAGVYAVEVTDSSTASHDILDTDYAQTGDPDHFGTADTSPSNNDNYGNPVVLAPGDVYLNMDFGYQPQGGAPVGSIGDTVWFDANASGGATQNTGENGIPGVTVALVQDTNGNGLWDAGEPIIATDTTDDNGEYFFEGLPLDDGDGDADYIVWVNDTDNVLDSLIQTYDAYGPLDDMSATALSSAAPDDLAQDFSYKEDSHDLGEGLIGDTIWFDLDNSGSSTQDAGEPGIEGVIVTLTDSSGSIITTTTDENGNYLFGGLDPNGTFTITVAPENFAPGGVLEGMNETFDPDGGTASQSVVDLSLTGPIDLTQDLSYIGSAASSGSIGNRVWLDQNADGDWDGTDGPDGIANTDDDEPGISGVTIDLYRDLDGNGVVDAGEPLFGATTTDSNGNYLFDDLPYSDYVVDVTDEDGILNGYWQSLGEQDETAGDPSADEQDESKADPFAVTIDAGTPDNLNIDFGYYVEPAALGNYVWLDSNSNGIQNSSEGGIDGVAVQLTINYPDGTEIELTTITGDNPETAAVEEGWYSFNNLLVDEDYNGSTADGSGEPVFEINIDTAQTALDDLNVTIIGESSATNDLNDSEDPAGTIATPIQGLTDSDQQSDPITEQALAGYDFGFTPSVLIGNQVWIEDDRDGDASTGNTIPVVDTIVTATSSAGDIYTATTDANGYYTITVPSNDTYTVTVGIPSNTEPSGTLISSDSDPNTNDGLSHNYAGTVVTVDTVDNLTIDFGFTPPFRLGNTVWSDLDNDGIQDASEPPLPGISIALLDGSGSPIISDFTGQPITTTTDSSGNYVFDALYAGEYMVHVLPENFDEPGDSLFGYLSSQTEQAPDPTQDPDNDGSNSDDNGLNDPNPAANGIYSHPVNLSLANEPTTEGSEEDGSYDDFNSDLSVDFGFFELMTLGNLIWIDVNDNGIVDPSESGAMAGIRLTLLDENGDPFIDPLTGEVVTTTTDANGNYYFSHLFPGTYMVQIDAENFQSGGPLEGYFGSTGSTDSETNGDNDDNGDNPDDPAVSGIRSTPIILSYGDEPANGEDGDDNGNTNFSIDFGVTLDATAVELLSFAATYTVFNEVELTWETGAEIDNFGFRILRSDTGRWEDAIDVHFESATVANGPGASYSHIDTVPGLGQYTYWLVDVETTGVETVHRSVTVLVGEGLDLALPFGIYLPIIER